MYMGVHVTYRYSCPTLIKLGFSRQIFLKKKKYSNTKFHENPSSGSRCSRRADRRTGRHDEANQSLSGILSMRLKTERSSKGIRE